jgi:3-oxoacyl-[acyl-carrier-protein] synthase II
MRRAVITATGMVGPKALDSASFWQRVKSGQSAIDLLTRTDTRETGCWIGGEVPDFSLDFMDSDLKPRRLARHTILLLKASLQVKPFLPSSFGIRIGISTSDSTLISQSTALRIHRGVGSVSSTAVVQTPPNAAVGILTQSLEATEESHTVSTACAAGLDAIGLAARDIIHGRSDCLIAGGADSPLGLCPMAEFVKSGLTSLRNEFPSRASRPFDTFADSGVLSEAAALCLVEDFEAARERGASIGAEIIGYSSFLDPDRSRPGSGYEECMCRALFSAGLEPIDIDYVSAWGPGHPVLDRAEAEAIRSVFGPYADDIPVTSIKGVLGNPLAAAGPAQVIAAIAGLAEQVIPFTANLDLPHADRPLNYVTGKPLTFPHETVLLNAHGVGGTNVCLILKHL